MVNSAEERGFDKAIQKIVKLLLDVLDDETTAVKIGLSIEDIVKLRNE